MLAASIDAPGAAGVAQSVVELAAASAERAVSVVCGSSS